ncbi:flagellin [Halopseudomonas pachastrellae]|nr:flagellin [Halopseudomonas pachastrellae]
MRSTLETGGSSSEDKWQRRDVIAVTLDNLDNAMNQVLSVQTTIGARMNVIESTLTENEEVSLINTAVTSELQDLDYAEALSRLSLQSVVWRRRNRALSKSAG